MKNLSKLVKTTQRRSFASSAVPQKKWVSINLRVLYSTIERKKDSRSWMQRPNRHSIDPSSHKRPWWVISRGRWSCRKWHFNRLRLLQARCHWQESIWKNRKGRESGLHPSSCCDSILSWGKASHSSLWRKRQWSHECNEHCSWPQLLAIHAFLNRCVWRWQFPKNQYTKRCDSLTKDNIWSEQGFQWASWRVLQRQVWSGLQVHQIPWCHQ